MSSTQQNNVLLNGEEALGSDQILKVTALLYLQEALVAQQYEICRELIDTDKTLGVEQSDISAVIAEYLTANSPTGHRQNRF